jgi:hypothetical protein
MPSRRRSSEAWWVVAGATLVLVALLGLIPWWVVPRVASGQSQSPGTGLLQRIRGFFGQSPPPQPYTAYPDDLPLMGWNGYKLQLLERRSVQTELQMTDQQKAQVESTLWSLRRRAPELRPPRVTVPPRKHSPEWKQLVQKEQKLEKAIRDTLQQMGTFLSPKQMKRLQQIALQLEGARAFHWHGYGEQMGRELKVTPQQLQKMVTIDQKYTRLREKLLPTGTPGADPVQERINSEKVNQLSYQEQDEKLTVLTDQQRARWKKMLGPQASFVRRIGDPMGPF